MALVPASNRIAAVTIMIVSGLLFMRSIKSSRQFAAAGKYRAVVGAFAAVVLVWWYAIKGSSMSELPWIVAALVGLGLLFAAIPSLSAGKTDNASVKPSA